MSKPLFIPRNKQEQYLYAQQINSELEKVTMSWDNVLKEWYPFAIRALDFASAVELQVPQNKVVDLFKDTVHGLNMNVVMALCNNVENRKPAEMVVSAKRWAEILLINHSVATRWQELALPVQQKVSKEFEIMSATRKPMLVAEA